jgi:dienelactone hydrolase
MLAFLAADKTDENVYDADTYNCYDYTRDVCGNAIAQGYRVGFVYMYFRESAHSLVCFNTIDNGLVYVEPQYDAIVNVKVGSRYWSEVPGVKSPFDDTIMRFGIIW